MQLLHKAQRKSDDAALFPLLGLAFPAALYRTGNVIRQRKRRETIEVHKHSPRRVMVVMLPPKRLRGCVASWDGPRMQKSAMVHAD